MREKLIQILFESGELVQGTGMFKEGGALDSLRCDYCKHWVPAEGERVGECRMLLRETDDTFFCRLWEQGIILSPWAFDQLNKVDVQ